MADIQDLLQLQFEEIGKWILKQNDKIDFVFIESLNQSDSIFLQKNILYSFVSVDKDGNSFIKYLGKTTKGTLTRLAQYRSGAGQATNSRVNVEIKELLNNNQTVKIFILQDLPALQWGGYNLNLPAGLEDSLIFSFKPEWNNTHGIIRSTLAELEDQNSIQDTENIAKESLPSFKKSEIPYGSFKWRLGETYFNYGFMNPGVKVDSCFGAAGENVNLIFPDNKIFKSVINRTANSNHTVRLHFPDCVDYFKKNKYCVGQIIEIQIYPDNNLFVQ
jgi:hypothetical protein